ncbi:hypothetical protein MKW92_026564, partial [Papaver armeniacum]
YLCHITLYRLIALRFENNACCIGEGYLHNEEQKHYKKIIWEEMSKEYIEKMLCEHKNFGNSHFSHGLCKNCYDYFIKLSERLRGGSETTAFQRAERERMAKATADTNVIKSSVSSSKETQDAVEKEKLSPEPSSHIGQEGATIGHQEVVEEGASDQPRYDEDMNTIAGDESESLSDIKNAEVEGYLHNEEEVHYKKIIWKEMNEYIQPHNHLAYALLICKPLWEQAAKEAAAAAAAAAAKEVKWAICRTRLSSRINYDVLDQLFDVSVHFYSFNQNPYERLLSDISDKSCLPATTLGDILNDKYGNMDTELFGIYREVGFLCISHSYNHHPPLYKPASLIPQGDVMVPHYCFFDC